MNISVDKMKDLLASGGVPDMPGVKLSADANDGDDKDKHKKKAKEKTTPATTTAQTLEPVTPAPAASGDRPERVKLSFGNDLFTEKNIGKSLNKSPNYIDGGFTNHIGITYMTKLNNGMSLSTALTNNMYTPHFTNGNELERPYVGQSELNAGIANIKLKSIGKAELESTTIAQGAIGYKDIGFTNNLQDTLHTFFDAEIPDYKAFPGKTGFTGNISAGKSYTYFQPVVGKVDVFAGVDAGATLGSDTGANAGLKLGVGTLKPSGQMNFKPESVPLEYMPKDSNAKGWNLTLKYDVNYSANNSLFNKGETHGTNRTGGTTDSDGNKYDFIRDVQATSTFRHITQSLSLSTEVNLGKVMLKAGVAAYTNPVDHAGATGAIFQKDPDGVMKQYNKIETADINIPSYNTYGYIGVSFNIGGKGRQ